MRYTFWLLLAAITLQPLRAQLPEGFNDILVGDDWRSIVGLTFDHNGRLYAWAKNGIVFLADNEVRLDEPLIDISEECADWGDHGLLGFALDPNFDSNGYFYLLYAVDRHHLIYHGTEDYNPNASLTNVASIGRVTRYTADPATDFTTTIPGSRHVLIGDSIHNGLPLLHASHGVGSLVFGTDGTLLVSMGDGASYAGTDIGGEGAGAYATQALADGIIDEGQDVGAFRAQQIQSLNGKILRIDKETGEGIPSNPFFDPNRPNAPESKVWALGLRNPYRISLKPGTGSHNPADADPGVIFVGDVGWAYWEEINVAEQGGRNFGWPIYEGLRDRWQYRGAITRNPYADNPLAWQNGCSQSHFYFQNLLINETQNPDPFFANPCDNWSEIPEDIPTFVHRRPVVAWSNIEWNTEEQDTHVPGFDDNGEAIIHSLNDPDCPVDGTMFTGKCTSGGLWVSGNNWPEAYQDKFYGADYTGWFRSFDFDEGNQLTKIDEFFEQGENIVDMAVHPVNGCLYYIEYAWSAKLRKICFGGNPPPTAVIEADKHYGPGPLDVNFSAAASTDPQNDPLSYEWDFGDGTSSTEMEPAHTFVTNSTEQEPFLVTLTVTDTAGGYHKDYLTVSLNNTPPRVRISSFEDSATYPVTGVTELPLRAEVIDAEDGASELAYSWQVFFHHNSHNHPEPVITEPEATVLVMPEGCGEEDYWYRIRLTVRDRGGLEASDEKELFPFCGDPLTVFDTLEATAKKSAVRLHWRTLEEAPDASFIIERSVDRLHFEEVGAMTAVGAPGEYDAADPRAPEGLLYYRIKTELPDGSYDFSPLAQVEFLRLEGIRLAPNPFEDQLTVVFDTVVQHAEFHLLDLRGSRLRNFYWEEDGYRLKYQIPTQILSAGVYLYEAYDGRRRYHGKVIKR